MQKIVSPTIANLDLKVKAKDLVKTFDGEFTNLAKVVVMQEKTNHEAALLNTVYTNVRNDLKEVDGNIK